MRAERREKQTDAATAPQVTTTPGLARVAFPAMSGRSVVIQTSPDLRDWTTWSAPGNDGISAPPGSLLELQAATGGAPAAFFRAVIREE